MKSWQRWGMRALALAMLLSLAAGPLMAGPRGGANDGDEYQDIIDSPNPDMLAGDPDTPYGKFDLQRSVLRGLRVQAALAFRLAALARGFPVVPVPSTRSSSRLGGAEGTLQ